VSRKRGGRTRPAKGQARTRIYKWKLCTGDTHLQYFTQFRRLANTFEESIWAYTVMHPSVMHEDTLRQSLVCDRSLPCPRMRSPILTAPCAPDSTTATRPELIRCCSTSTSWLLSVRTLRDQ
jgi:hypothetical protein